MVIEEYFWTFSISITVPFTPILIWPNKLKILIAGVPSDRAIIWFMSPVSSGKRREKSFKNRRILSKRPGLSYETVFPCLITASNSVSLPNWSWIIYTGRKCDIFHITPKSPQKISKRSNLNPLGMPMLITKAQSFCDDLELSTKI